MDCIKCGEALIDFVEREEHLCRSCLSHEMAVWGPHNLETLKVMAWKYGIDARVVDVMRAEQSNSNQGCDRARYRNGLEPAPSADEREDEYCDTCAALAECPEWRHGKGCDCRLCSKGGA